MRIKIKQTIYSAAWHHRDYLAGRTCEVLAIDARKTKVNKPAYKVYFVLHPLTKKPGYWIIDRDCEIIDNSKVPTWKQFLKNNKYGYSACPQCKKTIL